MILCVCKIFTKHNKLNEDDEKIYTRFLIIQIEFRIQRVGNHHSTNEKYFQLALQSLSNVDAVKFRFAQTAKKNIYHFSLDGRELTCADKANPKVIQEPKINLFA